ncbi:hypothetical protein [Pseudolabrys taiwanensis]|uniref:hypothetical protein n=1 Tax=Pseudolabrys taiwanensis TaxID=331696 RepID=UPI0013B3DB38|nr:hypothetical protein [Pseudolabrys taiwanensis]
MATIKVRMAKSSSRVGAGSATLAPQGGSLNRLSGNALLMKLPHRTRRIVRSSKILRFSA